VRGIGYYVAGLKAELQKILGLDREWPVALVGLGNLGAALFHYKGFSKQGFRIVAVFDDEPAKAGNTVDGVPIMPMRDLPKETKARQSPDRHRGRPRRVRPGGDGEAHRGRHQGHPQLRSRPHPRRQGTCGSRTWISPSSWSR
jgi:hypothetical protein